MRYSKELLEFIGGRQGITSKAYEDLNVLPRAISNTE
jgi:hypothetical protein